MADLIAPKKEESDFGLDRQVVAEFNAKWEKDKGQTMDDHCDAEHFTFDIHSEPHEGWNASAARVFAAYYLGDEGLPDDDYVLFKVIEEAFMKRVKTIRYHAAMSEEARRRHNSDTRKESVRVYSGTRAVLI